MNNNRKARGISHYTKNIIKHTDIKCFDSLFVFVVELESSFTYCFRKTTKYGFLLLNLHLCMNNFANIIITFITNKYLSSFRGHRICFFL